jgi:hypothetical protein
MTIVSFLVNPPPPPPPPFPFPNPLEGCYRACKTMLIFNSAAFLTNVIHAQGGKGGTAEGGGAMTRDTGIAVLRGATDFTLPRVPSDELGAIYAEVGGCGTAARGPRLPEREVSGCGTAVREPRLPEREAAGCVATVSGPRLPEREVRVVMVGDSGCGKTKLLNRFTRDVYTEVRS